MTEDKINNREKVGDVFDVLEMAGRVYSQDPLINRDFTLAYTDEGTEKFCKKQMFLAGAIYETLRRVDEEEARNVKDMLMSEVRIVLKQTISRNGRYLQACLKAPYAHIDGEEDQNKTDMSMMAKIFGGSRQNGREELPE